MFRAASSGLHGYITCIIKESGQCFCHIAKIQLLFPISLKMRMQCLDLLAFANHDYELWHPPDQTIFCGWLVKFRRLQVFLVSLVQQQPWPSLQLIFLDSTEVSNYCDETATENLPVVSPLEELRHRNLDGEHLLDPLSSLFPPFFSSCSQSFLSPTCSARRIRRGTCGGLLHWQHQPLRRRPVPWPWPCGAGGAAALCFGARIPPVLRLSPCLPQPADPLTHLRHQRGGAPPTPTRKLLQ